MDRQIDTNPEAAAQRAVMNATGMIAHMRAEGKRRVAAYHAKLAAREAERAVEQITRFDEVCAMVNAATPRLTPIVISDAKVDAALDTWLCRTDWRNPSEEQFWRAEMRSTLEAAAIVA